MQLSFQPPTYDVPPVPQGNSPSSGTLAPSTLTQNHYLVAHKLAQGRSKARICRELSITPPTIQNYFQIPDFVVLYEQLREEYLLKSNLPLEEIQRKINEEALASLECAIDIRDDAFDDSKRAGVRLKAAEMLLDRASNVPKILKGDEAPQVRDVFSSQFIQILVETARQVGDKEIFATANTVLKAIPHVDQKIIDLPSKPANTTPLEAKQPPIPPTRVKTLDELLSSGELDVEEED